MGQGAYIGGAAGAADTGPMVPTGIR
jgi:hypothetical protein